jgi:uncharacterized protein (DUF305 family)
MKKAFVLAIALAAATAGASAIAPRAATAADAPDMTIDCSKADSMMSDASKGTGPAMTGDLDKDFMLIVMDHEKGTAMIMKIEAQCGKDPKMKAMAQKQAQDADARMAEKTKN